RTAAVGAPSIHGQPPGDPGEPGSKALAIPDLVEAAIGTGEGVLRHFLGVGAVPQDAVGDVKREPGRIAQPGLELGVEFGIGVHNPGPATHPLIHWRSVTRRRRPRIGSLPSGSRHANSCGSANSAGMPPVCRNRIVSSGPTAPDRMSWISAAIA